MEDLLKRLQNMRWTDKRVKDTLRIIQGQTLPDGRTAAYKSKLKNRVRQLQAEAGFESDTAGWRACGECGCKGLSYRSAKGSGKGDS